MKITISVVEWLTRYTGGRSKWKVEVLPGTIVIDTVLASGIPKDEVGFITIKDEMVSNDHILENGDSIKVYTFILGG